MKRNIIIVMILWVSFLITACQGAGGSAPAAAGGSSSENPSQSSAPTAGTTTAPTTAPTSAPTTAPTGAEKLPLAELLADAAVLPRNEGTLDTSERVWLEHIYSNKELLDVPLGQVWMSREIQEALEEYPGDTVVGVTLSVHPMIERYKEMGYSEEELDGLKDMVWALFEEAGYTLYPGSYNNWFPFMYATLDQIRAIECGEHIALYLFIMGQNSW